MTMMYLVSCALRDPSHDYMPLWSALEKAGARRAMEAVWLLETDSSLQAITEAVRSHLEKSDRLFIAALGKNPWSATNLLDDTGVWLKTRLP
jgi:hypothetical protein